MGGRNGFGPLSEFKAKMKIPKSIPLPAILLLVALYMGHVSALGNEEGADDDLFEDAWVRESAVDAV